MHLVIIACTPNAAHTVGALLINVSRVSTCLSITRARFVVRFVDKTGKLEAITKWQNVSAETLQNVTIVTFMR